MSRIRRMYWHEADVIGDNPAIKNHTATLVGRYVLVFGGYDGHLNHNDVHALDTVTMRWKYKCKVSGTKPRGRNGHTATLAPGCRHEASALHVSTTAAPAAAAAADDADESRDSAAQKSNGESQSQAAANDDGATDVGAESGPSEGDGGRTESTGNDIALTKGRDSGCLHDRIFVVGGWLGRGPLAADDIHILHVRMCDVDGDGDDGLCCPSSPSSSSSPLTSSKRQQHAGDDNFRLELEWEQPHISGTPPGPCNMHTADYFESLRKVLVFRGGDGREYLNDLHALDVDTLHWTKLEPQRGTPPQPRANHCSVVIGSRLFVFGGWDGEKRLNDLHVFDTSTLVWSSPVTYGEPPLPRAGMTLCSVRNRLFLFGGSGHGASCYDDLQVFEPSTMCWMSVDNPGESDESQDEADEPLHGSKTHPRLRNIEAGTEIEMSTMEANGNGIGASSAGLEANPNDSAAHEVIVVRGSRGSGTPRSRAGHTATVCGRKMLVIGGSLQNKTYLSECFALDTDPPPELTLTVPSSADVLRDSLGQFVDSEEFADVTFVVEGRRVHGHKVILSLLSERFRAMFASTGGGFREATQREIELHDITYEAFLRMMHYLYTGKVPEIEVPAGRDARLHALVELLQTADQFMLDHLKQMCESLLQSMVTDQTSASQLLEVAEAFHATHLKHVCQHHMRNIGSMWSIGKF